MILRHNYYFFEKVIPGPVCQDIIDLGLKNIKRATVSGDIADDNIKRKDRLLAAEDKDIETLSKELGKTPAEIIREETYVRDSEVAWLNDKWLYDLFWDFLEISNREAQWRFDFDFAEDFQFTVYKPGQFYGWHADGVSDHSGVFKEDNPNFKGKVRKLSMTVNLTDPNEYEGGNLKFDFGPHSESGRFHTCNEIRPQGSVVVFPSFIHHQVTPVTKGTRYSLVLWALGRPFR